MVDVITEIFAESYDKFLLRKLGIAKCKSA